MNILFISDIIGEPGRRIVYQKLPFLIDKYELDICIGNGENAAGGFGITHKVAEELHGYGLDIITTGNHIWDRKEIYTFWDDHDYLLRPVNYSPDFPGRGTGIFHTKRNETIAVINIQGRVFMKDCDCPFKTVDRELSSMPKEVKVIIVDMHAETTSEKQAMGWYLDGRASGVFGTHTHVQTVDETIHPKGTAYITDTGMTGPFDSVIGMEKEGVINRFLKQNPEKFSVAKKDVKLSGVVVTVDTATGKAAKLERIMVGE